VDPKVTGSTPVGHPTSTVGGLQLVHSSHPRRRGLDAVIRGLGSALADDSRLLEYALPIYDGLLTTFGSSER
jgi:hypothetical protein